jgi:hypothetical protein
MQDKATSRPLMVERVLKPLQISIIVPCHFLTLAFRFAAQGRFRFENPDCAIIESVFSAPPM